MNTKHRPGKIIDLALGMQRIGANTEEEAMNAMSVLYKTLQVDIPALRKAQENNDILETRDILHKVKGGLCYSGTPRLEEAIKLLHADVKRTSDLSKISDLFSLVYHETNLVCRQFKELIGRDKK